MDAFTILIAGYAARVYPLYESTRAYCRDYLTDLAPVWEFRVTWDDLIKEQELLDLEADEEGLKRRNFSGPFLERSAIQRHFAERIVMHRRILMHGSTVAVDGNAYLFTAACGTGKSTHTRLWRELFGDRAVMVNDDKPFIWIGEEGVFAYGSPWTGKHGLGTNICLPLKGICILKRGTSNRIFSTVRADTIEMLRSQCFVPEDPDAASFVLDLVEQLADSVPLWTMECTKELEAAMIAYQAMSAD